jgi:hypothetical protein
MSSGAVKYVPSFIKTDSGVQRLIRGDTQTHTNNLSLSLSHTHTHARARGQQHDLISLYFFK